MAFISDKSLNFESNSFSETKIFLTKQKNIGRKKLEILSDRQIGIIIIFGPWKLFRYRIGHLRFRKLLKGRCRKLRSPRKLSECRTLLQAIFKFSDKTALWYLRSSSSGLTSCCLLILVPHSQPSGLSLSLSHPFTKGLVSLL